MPIPTTRSVCQIGLAMALAAHCAGPAAFAASPDVPKYPERPVRIVIGFTPAACLTSPRA